MSEPFQLLSFTDQPRVHTQPRIVWVPWFFPGVKATGMET
jgi:hypothetical protein